MLTAATLASCSSSDDEPKVTYSPYCTKVFEYTPAPGQFINETVTGGFTGDETTPAAAAAYAKSRLAAQQFVSLGTFGGYIVVGFDHSIANSGGYDIAILGNALDLSNEPGIVWVMQDANGNGLPDDTWYELRGSETGKSSTRQNYSVTYFRPSGPGRDVAWRDSDGLEGTVDYLAAYHKQDYYYPAWITADSYTLTGTRLEARNSMDAETGIWSNPAYDWGYADNIGSDSFGDGSRWTAFKISNAMAADGTPVTLTSIDFVKVQQAVLAKSGWIGENSCEIFSIADYSLLPK